MKFLGLILLLSAVLLPVPPGLAEDYKATLEGHDFTIPLPPGTQVDDGSSPEMSSYSFNIVDRKTMQKKMQIHFIISPNPDKASIPKNEGDAKKTFSGLIAATGVKVPEVEVMKITDMNPAFTVYWAPYYKFQTGNADTPYMILKPTMLVDKENRFAVLISTQGFVTVKDASEKDLVLGEKFMDQFIAPMVQKATAHKKS